MTPQRAVMLVEDEPDLLTLFGGMMQRQGYTVLQANGGAEAIALLRTHTPDLIVLDLAMPQVNGFDVLAMIQQTSRLDQTIVVVLTALGNTAAQAPETQRADHWLNKPVTPSFLNAFITDLLAPLGPS